MAAVVACAAGTAAAPAAAAPRGADARQFSVEEATIAEIQQAIRRGRVTTTEIVESYLERVKAYNGTCVNQPEGILGPVSTIPKAGKVNALITLNLRPDTREEWGFDERNARSMTDEADDDPDMPDALEVAARLDRTFRRTRELAGPLHGVVLAIKDQYDTFDMRTTSAADAFWADDRPPDDATFVERLRDAGAIILAKANMGEYAAGGMTGTRSSFGGVGCNAYDTERDPGASSGGSGASVATNMVTCAIAEETGTSVREPAKNHNTVGLAPTRELVSADGMMQRGITTRVGPICRTVEDAARILNAYAGFDPADELTSFSYGRMPSRPYQSFAKAGSLRGMRIGVVREYMDKDLFTIADEESIDIVDRAIDDLRDLGATIVDPGAGGALFQGCVDKYSPTWRNALFTRQFPELFPVDENGEPVGDHVETLLDMFFDPELVPHSASGQPSIRNLGSRAGDSGDARYNWNAYLRERGDANIQTLTDLIEKANHWNDPAIPSRRQSLVNADDDLTLDSRASLQDRFTMQTVVHQCFALMELDAVVYPTGSIPPQLLTSAEAPSVNDRPSSIWTQINRSGFPAMTVPAGFTTTVHDWSAEAGQFLPPKAARLPVGIDVLGLPFDEGKLFAIGAAYEAATGHRTPPPGFGPVEATADPGPGRGRAAGRR